MSKTNSSNPHTRARVLAAIREAADGITITELQDALGCSHATVCVNVDALVASKQVQKVGKRRDMRIVAMGAAVRVVAKKEGHTCYTSPYIGECIGCRNERRWTRYKENPFPIFGKSGVVRTQA